MRGLFANPSLALESIQFQSGNFFKELSIVFAQLQKVSDKDLPHSDLFIQIAQVIKKHTNLTITPTISDYGPAIRLPELDRNHPLILSYYRDFMTSGDGVREIEAAGGLIRGSVNLKSGRVEGIFADLSAFLMLSVDNIRHDKFSAEELAAITLHEIGHMFVYCEMVSRSVTTNYVLANLARALDGSASGDQREMVLMTVRKALKLKKLDPKSLAKVGNNRTVEEIIIAAVIHETASELGSSMYDAHGFEYLADEYATRQGAGRPLVTALDKLHRASGHSSYWSTALYLIWEVIKLALLFLPGVNAFMIIQLLLLPSRDGEHENPEARTRRVRNQLVEALKAKKLAPEQYATLKADLVACDKILAQVNDRRTFVEAFLEYVVPSMRHEWQQLVLQKQLEDIALNELFVKAQDLKQLA